MVMDENNVLGQNDISGKGKNKMKQHYEDKNLSGPKG